MSHGLTECWLFMVCCFYDARMSTEAPLLEDSSRGAPTQGIEPPREYVQVLTLVPVT